MAAVPNPNPNTNPNPNPNPNQVFAHFDEFSYELSKMDLSHFRTGAMRNDIMQAARQ